MFRCGHERGVKHDDKCYQNKDDRQKEELVLGGTCWTAFLLPVVILLEILAFLETIKCAQVKNKVAKSDLCQKNFAYGKL